MTITLNSAQRKWGVILLLLFLCAVKIPPTLNADIQPWDEGMYAARVNSIHVNGDFFDQSSHSVAGFESGVHPPLFIWVGYGFTSIFGTDEVVFKLIAFIFGLLCVLYIIKLGEQIHSFEAGFLSAMIFSATYVFSVYAKRFQFDIAITFLFILCFYFIVTYLNENGRKYLYWGAVVFGLCLMTKSLFGLFVPFTLLIYLFAQPRPWRFRFSDLVIFSAIGLILALPWHLYMYLKHGNEFTQYLFGFHLLKRATEGIGGNAKPSGIFYYFSLIMNNIPFGIIVFYALIRDFIPFKKPDWKKVLLWSWFLSGFVVISLFTTKIETYLMPFLIPACLLLVLFFFRERKPSTGEMFIILTLFIINLFWYMTPAVRNEIKTYVMSPVGGIITLTVLALAMTLLFVFSKKFSERVDLKKAFIYVTVIFFLGANIYYLFNISMFEDGFKLAEIKKLSDESGRNELIYIGSNYEMNPQFSYYFNGIDLNTKGKYEYKLLDLKDGTESVKDYLNGLDKGKYIILLERDQINTGEEFDAKLFIPEGSQLKKKTHGYEMYLN